ncbi:MAG: hypothetical protein GX587_00740 [Bacteroidales bacterium]|nr:hypothetical protein [Bacteroidales bacterium]
MRPLIAMSYGKELVYTRTFLGIMIVMLIVYFVKWVKRKDFAPGVKNLKADNWEGDRPFNIWLAISIIFLVLLFIMPDSDGHAGFISDRLCFLFYLFFTIWVISLKHSRRVMIIASSLVIFISLCTAHLYMKRVKNHSQIACDIEQLSGSIKENSIVLPLSIHKNWMYGHLSNYLGVDKAMIILENYESSTGYFPLNWNHKSIPNVTLGDISANVFPCINWVTNVENETKAIDYIFILKDFETEPEPCITQFLDSVKVYYRLIDNNQSGMIYGLKE